MDDLISRQAAIEDIKECAQAAHSMHEWDMEQGYINAIECLEELPSAQPERIRGRWIEKPHVHGVAYCSLCDYELHTNDTNFCPNCGAKMGGRRDESDRCR